MEIIILILYFHSLSSFSLPSSRFMLVFNLACLDFAMQRLLLYTMAHTFKDYQFLPRVVRSLFSYILDQIAAGSFTSLITSPNSKL